MANINLMLNLDLKLVKRLWFLCLRDEHLSELVPLCSSCHKHVLERLLKRKEFDIKGFLRRLEDVYDRTKKRGQ